MADIIIPDPDDSEAERASESEDEGNFVRVNFAKFVQLIANHDFEEVIKERGDEEILVAPNLLTDLANAHEGDASETRKLPLILLTGVILGIIVTYIVMQF